MKSLKDFKKRKALESATNDCFVKNKIDEIIQLRLKLIELELKQINLIVNAKTEFENPLVFKPKYNTKLIRFLDNDLSQLEYSILKVKIKSKEESELFALDDFKTDLILYILELQSLISENGFSDLESAINIFEKLTICFNAFTQNKKALRSFSYLENTFVKVLEMSD